MRPPWHTAPLCAQGGCFFRGGRGVGRPRRPQRMLGSRPACAARTTPRCAPPQPACGSARLQRAGARCPQCRLCCIGSGRRPAGARALASQTSTECFWRVTNDRSKVGPAKNARDVGARGVPATARVALRWGCPNARGRDRLAQDAQHRCAHHVWEPAPMQPLKPQLHKQNDGGKRGGGATVPHREATRATKMSAGTLVRKCGDKARTKWLWRTPAEGRPPFRHRTPCARQ